MLHALPVLCALRDALPQAHLAWMVEGRSADLLAGHPALDEVVAVRRRWLKSPRAVFDLWRRVHGRFDVTIDVQGLSKSAVAARLSGGPAADRTWPPPMAAKSAPGSTTCSCGRPPRT